MALYPLFGNDYSHFKKPDKTQKQGKFWVKDINNALLPLQNLNDRHKTR